jgi:probable HAF family extracellular repeat protein
VSGLPFRKRYLKHGFLYDQGSYTTLDAPGGSGAIFALGINTSGQIVGYYYHAGSTTHGFLLDQGSYTTLDVPGALYTYATGINASGQIVGIYYDAAKRIHGLLPAGAR